MSLTIGIDSGSTATKDPVRPQGRRAHRPPLSGADPFRPLAAIEQGWETLYRAARAPPSDPDRLWPRSGIVRRSAGHRDLLPRAGARLLCPSVYTVIDIGGQDSKVIQLDGEGNLTDFLMNDKCAAGTYRFLE